MICNDVGVIPQSKIIVKSNVGSSVIENWIVSPDLIVDFDTSISKELIAG